MKPRSWHNSAEAHRLRKEHVKPAFVDGFRLPAEEPVFRGPGNKQTKTLNAERRCQCRRLRAAGWSLGGLAQLYAIERNSVFRAAHRYDSRTKEDPLPAPTSYSVTLAQKIEEALILIRLGCWDDPKKVAWPTCSKTGEKIDPRLVEMARQVRDKAIADGAWPTPANKTANER